MSEKNLLNEVHKPLILIVDDVPKNLQVLGTILEEQACDIAMATSGIQAFKIIADVLPDLILLDIMMPEMDGLEVCKRLKDSIETKDIPVIFITAKTEVEDIIKGFERGAVVYVTKPFNAKELQARVSTHLELKMSRDANKQLIEKLQKALTDIKQLSGLLPICSHCKKIRDDKGYWNQIEAYILEHSDAQLSHSICPDCAQEHYPELSIYKDE